VTTAPQSSAAVEPDPAVLRGVGLRAPRKRPPAWVIGSAIVLLGVAAWISAASVDSDSGSDLLGLIRSVGVDIVHLRWQYTAVVVLLAVVHYFATAVAAKAAAGVPLPLGETLLVQLAAAAANRLTPAGLGGSVLTARYFTRRGLDAPAAVGAVTALAILGALSDLLVLVALVLIGNWLGIHGSRHEFAELTQHISRLLGPVRSPFLWIVIGVAAIAIVGIYALRHRAIRSRDWTSHLWQPIRRLGAHPGALATLMTASGCTTLVLGFAFIATTAMVPGPVPQASLGALLIAFMLGAAAGNAVPVPAGLGSSEAAFIAVLISVQVPAAHAVEEVLIFRLITFWIPAAVGILATRYLYRRHAI
jgi:uncharacterized membrane protein YbhN (UPF0104 family)